MPEMLITDSEPTDLMPIETPLPRLTLRTTESIPGARKAAIFLVAIGEDRASEIFKYLEEDEVQQISKELASLPHVSSNVTEDVVEEFQQLLVAQTYIAKGGVEYSKRLL